MLQDKVEVWETRRKNKCDEKYFMVTHCVCEGFFNLPKRQKVILFKSLLLI